MERQRNEFPYECCNFLDTKRRDEIIFHSDNVVECFDHRVRRIIFFANKSHQPLETLFKTLILSSRYCLQMSLDIFTKLF